MPGSYENTVVSFLIRYKVHHIIFWACYHFVWWTVYTNSISAVIDSFEYTHTIIKYLGYVVVQAVGVYFCLYVLIPKYLIKGKYLHFFISVAIVILGMAALITANYFFAASFSEQSVYVLFKISPATPATIFLHNALSSCISATTLGMSIKLAKNWLDAQKRQQLLEKEKLETELKFLKSQFNPHFLFNTINSIFVLINKNPEMASESLVKFSSLMRYQLYECNSNQIPLRNELAYIESFIELESLRQNDNFDLEIKIPKITAETLTVAPFILIPFIENAFKHISEDKELRKWLNLSIGIENNQLNFELSNSANYEVRHQLPEGINYGGLGLKNVKRRLDLIYPNAHVLLIKKGKDVHTVKLVLTLAHIVRAHLKKVSV